jgi:arginyl-tRNA synthetase
VISAMGGQPDNFSVQLVQFAILYRGKERVQMSTRSGSFVTLQELIDEVGKDAARFFYVMRKVEQHMDFDLELAKSQTNENPVYYIQYAYARICSILRQVEEKGFSIDTDLGLQSLGKLSIPQEIDLICDVGRFPEIIEMSARAYEPHQIAHYLRDVANNFHSYYNAEQVLVEDDALRNARLCLIKAVQNIIANSLTLLGVSAPQKM